MSIPYLTIEGNIASFTTTKVKLSQVTKKINRAIKDGTLVLPLAFLTQIDAINAKIEKAHQTLRQTLLGRIKLIFAKIFGCAAEKIRLEEWEPGQLRKIATTKHVVCFHESGPAKALSNFDTREDVAFTFRGHSFRCAEAAYLWARLHHTRNHKLGQLFTCNGERALVLSQELEGLYPKVEDTVLMRQVLVAKFKNPVWRSLLDATKGAYLLSMGSDPFWSAGSDGTGQNMLGRTLMAVRNYFRDGLLPERHPQQTTFVEKSQ